MTTMQPLLAFTLAAFPVVAVAAPSKPIALVYKPAKGAAVARPAIPPALLEGPVRLEVIDRRDLEDPAVVGSQTEKGAEVYTWRARQPVAPAVRGFIATILKEWSVPVAESGERALSVSLKRYWCDERSAMFGSNYEAQVALGVSVIDRAGAVSWTRDGEGKAGHSAVDGREAACNEFLAGALGDALAQALNAGVDAGAAPARAPAPIVVEPQTLLDELTRLKQAGVADDVLLAYVKQRTLSRPLTVDEILAWKNAGMPDAVIKSVVQ